MGVSETQSGFDIQGLSLIDVSSEDDCLINSPLCNRINPQSSEKGSGTKSVRFAMDPDNGEISLGSFEENGKLEEPPDSLEQDKTRKNGKYNLRKSLAWDSAFFTSAGFLDPEELSSMIGGSEKAACEMHTLPGIQEDVSKSCDSLATLDSETLTLENLEADFFEDIRASIQKSNKASSTANSSGKKEAETTETQTVSSSEKVELATQDKMKQKAAPKRPKIGVKDSSKTLKQVSVRPQISQTVQSVVKNRESTSSLHKPPKVLSKAGPISTIPTKRVSLGAKNLKIENAGKGTTVSKTSALGGLRNIVPRPTLSSKSSSCSPASSKTELTTSCSSLESCASASSARITTSSLNLIKQKNDFVRVNPSSSGRTITTPSKIASKGKNQTGSSKLSIFLKSSTKLSSSISPASSISEWSSESSSSTSTVNQRSNIIRASLGTGSHKGLSKNTDADQVMDSQNHPTGQCPVGDGAEVTGPLDESINRVSAGSSGLLHPASMKPSGLRMPSPKIGFFDGVRSSGRTPNGSMLSHPGVPSGLPKIGAKSNSPSGSSNKGKIQPARTLTAIRSPKVDVKQTSSAVKSRSSLTIQKSPSAATKATSVSRNPKSSPGISPKLQNKSSPKTCRESYSKAQVIGSAQKIESPSFPKQVVGLGGKDGGRLKDTKIVPLDGVHEINDNLTSIYDVQSIIPSKDAAENEAYSHQYPKTHIEDQIAGLVRNARAVELDMNSDARKEPIADCHLAHDDKKSENSLSKPICSSLSPVTSEITAGSRRPLSVKDSFYNMDIPVAVLPGSPVAIDKTTTLPIPDSNLPENSQHN